QKFGFDMRGRYIVWIDPLLAGYQQNQLENLYERIQERMRRVPGVRDATIALYAPMSGDRWNDSIRVEGKPEPRAKDEVYAGDTRVMPGFFETIGNRIVMGRPITEE